MRKILDKFRPSLPPVAFMMEAPSVMALRVDKPGKAMQSLVRHEEAMAGLVGGFGAAEDGTGRIADALLTRDRGYYRRCFRGLRVVDPSEA